MKKKNSSSIWNYWSRWFLLSRIPFKKKISISNEWAIGETF